MFARISPVVVAVLLILASLAALPGCEGNSLREAQMMDTPEAYEAYLAKYPDSTQAEFLRQRIEELRFLRARSDKTSAAYAEYLLNHPNGKHVKEATKLEDKLAYDEAEQVATAQAFQAYLDSHPTGKFVQKARNEMEETLYLDKIEVGNYRIEQINLANDPKGPKNGYAILADVVNNGQRTLVEVQCLLQFLGDAGQELDTRTWWAVAPGLVGMPTPPEIVPPLLPGGKRVFEYTLGEVPEGWTQAVAIKITNLRFED